MQTLDDIIYRELEKVAKKRGITIQELIRAVIVPEWINGHNGNENKEPGSNKLNSWRFLRQIQLESSGNRQGYGKRLDRR